MNHSDVTVMVLIVAVVLAWIWYRFRRWLRAPTLLRLPFPVKPNSVKGDGAEILREAGYEVVAGKHRIPIDLLVDGKPERSQVFVDYIAKMGPEWFVVKVDRERKPFVWTGSGIRDRLLHYLLLFDEAAGLLVVDPKQRKVRKIYITIQLEETD